jgi:Mce-associated membrane protein
MGDPTRDRRDRHGPAGAVAAGLGVLVVAMLAVTAYLTVRTSRADAAEELRQEVLAAARQEAVNLTSQDHTSIDRDLDRMVRGTTGDLRADLDRQRARYRDTFVKNALRAEGSATEAGVVTMRDHSATVLVVIDQVVRSDAKGGAGTPQTRHYRLELDMSRVDGRWLASGLRAAGLVS